MPSAAQSVNLRSRASPIPRDAWEGPTLAASPWMWSLAGVISISPHSSLPRVLLLCAGTISVEDRGLCFWCSSNGWCSSLRLWRMDIGWVCRSFVEAAGQLSVRSISASTPAVASFAWLPNKLWFKLCEDDFAPATPSRQLRSDMSERQLLGLRSSSKNLRPFCTPRKGCQLYSRLCTHNFTF